MANFALSFNGTSSYVACGAGDPSASGLTVGGWLKWNGANAGASSQVLVSKHTLYNTNMRWWIGLNTGNGKFLVYGNGSLFPTWNYTPPSNGTVIHWAWVHDTVNNVEKLYINGAYNSNAANAIGLGGQTGATLQIGASTNGTAEWLNGTQEDVFINTNILNATQILSIYNGTNPTTISGAWATYPMDEGSGTSTADTSGTNTGTLSGSTKPSWVSSINPNDVIVPVLYPSFIPNHFRPAMFKPG